MNFCSSNAEFISDVKFERRIKYRFDTNFSHFKSKQRRREYFSSVRFRMLSSQRNNISLIDMNLSKSPIFSYCKHRKSRSNAKITGSRFAEKGSHPPAYTTVLLQLLVSDSFADRATWRTVTCDRIVIRVFLLIKKKNLQKLNYEINPQSAAILNRAFHVFLRWLFASQHTAKNKNCANIYLQKYDN